MNEIWNALCLFGKYYQINSIANIRFSKEKVTSKKIQLNDV